MKKTNNIWIILLVGIAISSLGLMIVELAYHYLHKDLFTLLFIGVFLSSLCGAILSDRRL